MSDQSGLYYEEREEFVFWPLYEPFGRLFIVPKKEWLEFWEEASDAKE